MTSEGGPTDPARQGGEEDWSTWMRSGPNYQPLPNAARPQAQHGPAPYGYPTQSPAYVGRIPWPPLLVAALLGAILGAAIVLLIIWLT